MNRATWVVLGALVACLCLTGVAVAAFTDSETNPQTITAIEDFPGTGLKAKSIQSTAAGKEVFIPFKVVNVGAAPVVLSEVKVRYWFTRDVDGAISDDCQAGCDQVTTRLQSVSPVRDQADYYIEAGYRGGAGTLAPGASTPATTMTVRGPNGSIFNPSNDYSGTATSLVNFEDNLQVTVYIGGQLVWGTEPRVLEVKLAPRSIRLTTEPSGLTMFSFGVGFRNTGDLPVDLSKVEMRYWFTKDSVNKINVNCTNFCDSINVSVVNVTLGAGRPDRYVRVQFRASQTVPVGTTIDGPYITVSVNGSGLFDQTNDYSYQAVDGWVDNLNVPIYFDGKLVGGTEP